MRACLESLLFPVVLSSFLCITCPGPSLADTSPTPEQLIWLEAQALPFATDDPSQGLEDLEALWDIVGNARIVALGECTHGTREIFRMKHRVVRFLVEEMGFTIFSIEASLPEAYSVGDWVAGGEGDPAEAVAGMYFWTWNTEEVVEMVRWMRSHRKSGGDISFTGFDMQYPQVAARNVEEFVELAAPERLEEVRGVYEESLHAAQGNDFGVVTWSFPAEEAAGKTLRYRGWIRTEDSKKGFAGLWWRADGPEGTIAFDNMADRAPKGTTDWIEYEVELEIPAETVNVNFGVLMTGYGQAWFDGLSIELDGEEWRGDLAAELGFDEDVTAYRSQAGSYRSEYDTEWTQSGSRSLRLECLDEYEPGRLTAEDAAELAGGVVAILEKSRGELQGASDPGQIEWAIRNATVVHQTLRMRARTAHRDQCMAENVQWILDRNPGARIVLWAHNSHVSTLEPWMGAHLAETYGDDYVAVAFATGRGEYFAKDMREEGGGALGVHALAEPSPGSVESFFDQAHSDRLVLDLRTAENGSPGSGWLHEARPFRNLGALATERQFYPTKIAEGWDVLIWFAESSAARQMDTPRPKPD